MIIKTTRAKWAMFNKTGLCSILGKNTWRRMLLNSALYSFGVLTYIHLNGYITIGK